MKYVGRLAIGVITFLLFASSLEAQILDRIRNRAQQAAEDRVQQRIDREVERAAEQMVDQAWQSIFGDGIVGSGEGRGSIFSLNSNVTTEDTYSFDIITTMEIEIIDQNGEAEPPMIMKMHFNEDEMYTGTQFSGQQMDMEGGEVFIIYDFNNSAMVMLMESEEGKFSFAYDWSQALELIEDEDEEYTYEDADWDELEEWQNFTRIGSKNILGYDSEGFESRDENDDILVQLWVTRDVGFGMEKMFQANANAKQLQGTIPEDYPYGMMMEMTSENLKNGEKTIMRVTDISKNTRVDYNMSDYPVLSFGRE